MIYCILGQTASGKTSLALKLARKYELPIFSADAFQCYKMMQIGTDKPKREEVEGLKYHYYDEYEPDHETSVFEFQKENRPLLEQYLKEGKNVLVVGGTLLYIKALLFNYVFSEEKEKNTTYDSLSLEEMQALLKERSPETYSAIDNQNPRRVIRALIQLDDGTKREDILKENTGEVLYPTKFCQIEIDKYLGNEKIDKRIDLMVKEGLIEEIKALLEKYPNGSRAFSTIGYVEIIDALKAGKKIDKSVIDLIKIHTHQYAKKQRTFLRNQFKDAIKGTKEEIEAFIENDLKERRVS